MCPQDTFLFSSLWRNKEKMRSGFGQPRSAEAATRRRSAKKYVTERKTSSGHSVHTNISNAHRAFSSLVAREAANQI